MPLSLSPHQFIYGTLSLLILSLLHPWSSGLVLMLVLMNEGIWLFIWVIKHHVHVLVTIQTGMDLYKLL